MPSQFRYSVPALLQLATVMLAVSPALADWTKNVSYGGSGPTMEYYVPAKPADSPAIVVALHYCGGNASNVESWFKSDADKYGFLIIAPQVANAGANVCWDSTPGRSGDPASIAKMVDYLIKEKNADKSRVFAAGASSGAMMTNALCASYPDVFAGGSVLAGVPAGFWNGGHSCGVCSQNAPPNNTAQQWGDIARKAGPSGWSGPWPRMQLWHAAQDQYLNPKNLDAEVAQWTNVWGVSTANPTVEQNTPKSGWTRTSYKNEDGVVVVESNYWGSSPANSHDLTGQGLFGDVVRFFGLDKPSTGTTTDAGPQGTGGSASPAKDAGGSVGRGGSGTPADAGPATGTDRGGSANTAAGGNGNAEGGKAGASTAGSRAGNEGGSLGNAGSDHKGGAQQTTGTAGDSTEASSGSGGSSTTDRGSNSGKAGSSSKNNGGSHESAGEQEGSGNEPHSGGGCTLAAGSEAGALSALVGLMIVLGGGLVRRSARVRRR